MSWRPNPLRNKIIVALIKRKGEIIDDDLMRMMQKTDPSLMDKTLQKELMYLEINGIVSISQITKTRKRIKLINEDRINPSILSDM